MARFYRLQLETVYLTDTGAISGRPCKLRIAGVADLRVAYGGQTAPSADGTVREEGNKLEEALEEEVTA